MFKMRRIVSIVTLVFFLLATNGFAVNINYCCGKISSVTLAGAAKEKSCRQMNKMPNCCKHEHKYIRLKFNTLTSAVNVLSPVYHAVTAISTYHNYINSLYAGVSLSGSAIVPSESPPGKPHAYLLYRSILV